MATLFVSLLVVPLLFGCAALGAVVVGPGVRRWAALGCSALPLVLAAFYPAPLPILRGWIWLGGLILAMRMVDVAARADRSVTERLAHALLVYDADLAVPAPPALDTRLLARTVAYAAVTAAGLGAAAAAPVWIGRELAGLVVFYAAVETLDGVVRVPMRLCGLALRPLQDAPYRSRSLGELWGRRWNREIGGWLHHRCFRPFARRGHPGVGVLTAFVVSGVLHAVPMYMAVDLRMAGWMLAFFVAHGVLVLAERAIGVGRWPAWAGHVWTVGAFVVTGPLFVEPGLRFVGLSPMR